MRQRDSCLQALPPNHFDESKHMARLTETLCWLMVTDSKCHLTGQTVWRPDPWNTEGPFRYEKESRDSQALLLIIVYKALFITLHHIHAGTDLKLPFPLIWAALDNGVTMWHLFKCKFQRMKKKKVLWLKTVPGLLLKVTVCFAEVKIRSFNAAFVVPEEHLESLKEHFHRCWVHMLRVHSQCLQRCKEGASAVGPSQRHHAVTNYNITQNSRGVSEHNTKT